MTSKGKGGKKSAAQGRKKPSKRAAKKKAAKKKAAKKSVAKKKRAKAKAAKKGTAHAVKAKNGGAHAAPPTANGGGEPPVMLEMASASVQLWDAICVTPNCATPALVRGVSSLKATNVANRHVTDEPDHDAQVVPEV